MANKDATLQQGEEQIYPRTFTRNVYNNDGKTNLDTTLAQLRQQIENINIAIDNELSYESENPVSNKVIANEFARLETYITEQDNNIQENVSVQIQNVYNNINDLSESINNLLVEVNNNINNLENTKQNKLNFSEDFIVDENNNVSLNINIPNITIDSELSSESENGISNKTVTEALNKTVNTTTDQLIGGKKTFTSTPQVRFGGARLPDEYKEVEYIKATGSQYFDTGIVNTSNIGFEVECAMKIGYSEYSYLMGSASSNETNFCINGYNQSNSAGRFFYGSTNKKASLGMTSNTKTKLSLLNKIFYKNDTQLVDVNNVTFTGTHTIYLCAYNNGGTIKTSEDTTIYVAKFYEHDLLIRDFVPCYRISDNESGLYDLVGKQFYPNIGTGVLERGPIVVLDDIEFEDVILKKDLENYYTKEEVNTLINNDSSTGSNLITYSTEEQLIGK